MIKRALSLVIVLFMLVSATTACSSSTPDSKGPGGSEAAKVSFTDSAGRQVEVPAEITRIAPSGALAQMVLFALAPDMFVGLADKWSADTEQYLSTEYYNLPVLGHFYKGGDLNLEQVIKVDPQVIIDIGEPKPSIKEDMDGIQEQLGIPAIHIGSATGSMPEVYRILGRLLGREEKAEFLAEYCEEIYDNTLRIMEDVGENDKVSLLYCSGEDGLNVLARDSFHAEILDLVSDNLAVINNPSSKGTGTPVDMEQIMLWDPEAVIFAPDGAYKTVSESKAWLELDAIGKGKYYEVPEGPYNWMGSPPSVNRYMGMIWITQLLYPEKAGYDVYEEAVRYYKLFYDCDLTREQYQSLVSHSLPSSTP